MWLDRIKNSKGRFAKFILNRKVGFVVSILLFVFLWLQFAPLPYSLSNPHYAKILLSREGNLLGAKIADDHQWRFEPVETLPKKYETTLILFEDENFYRHFGVNPLAIARATYSNLRERRVVSGGSTITMQLARMLRNESVLNAAEEDEVVKAPARNLWSKLVETEIALRLEWRLSKQEILRAYANHAPFGGNTIGLHAAAWRYFGRAPEQLSWAEAALLAVLPNSPSMIHLGKDRKGLQQKRDRLLQKLLDKKLISATDFQLAVLEPLPEKPQTLPQIAPHLLTRLVSENTNQSTFNSTLQYAIQVRANQIVEQHSKRLANEGVNNIAVLIIDHEHFQTIAYVGNHAWQNLPQYAPSVDIIQRPRSTGSILKPLLFATMLQDSELTPATLVPDVPTQFGSFTPQNYDRQFRGAVPAQQALAQSLNIPSVHMLKQYGVGRFHAQLKSLGMTTLFRPADDYGLTLILGGGEGNLWEITSIYAKMIASARDGSLSLQPEKISLLMNQKAVSEIKNNLEGSRHPRASGDPKNTANENGKSKLLDPRIREDDERTNKLKPPAISQGAAWLTLQAMIEVARPGNDSQWRDFEGSQTIAWKTGTSYGLRDAWAIGSNSRYTVGVWTGNAGGEPAPSLTGTSSAAPILFDIFGSLGTSQWLNKPESALKKISVCTDDGYLAGELCETREQEIPKESHFATQTPFHKLIHLNKEKNRRVHSECESVSNMQNVNWFVLPAAQEYFWRQSHSHYASLPPWRTDCLTKVAEVDDDKPMDLLYPHETSKIFLPRDINGERTRLLVRAVHRNNKEKIWWHVDDNFLGATQVFHEQTLSLEPGPHKLLLIDEQGYKLERWFKILGEDDKRDVH